jgi:hypothetical protein
MKQIIGKTIIFFLGLLIGNIIYADLTGFYKKGTIKLIPAPGFGENTDWETLFYDKYKELTVAADGRIFVSNSRQHNIFKFSKNGGFLKKFSQKGRGPGDTIQPGNLSILDGKYLVVGERSTTRRVSVFDFSGKCFKVIRTNHSIHSPIALKNNNIAYLRHKYSGMEKNTSLVDSVQHTTIIIKNTETGKEKEITSISIPDRSWIKIKGTPGGIRLENFIAQVMISQTKDGNLLAAVSNSPLIKIYSFDGKLLHTFRLNMTPFPVTNDYIARFKAYKVGYLSASKGKQGSADRFMAKIMKKFPFEHLFAEHLPYFRNVLVDSEGNILVFKWTDCIGDCTKIFQVYSPEGKFICETKIDEGVFDFELSRFRNNIIFTDRGIFGLFQLKDSDDVSLRLVKVNVE